MRLFFSRRHAKALEAKKVLPSFTKRLRIAIRQTLEMYSNSHNYENYSFEEIEATLKRFYGENRLTAYNTEGKLAPCDLTGLIENGIPAKVLDVIEAFCDNCEPGRIGICEKELNSIFEIHNSPWRVVNGTVFLVDSEYLHNEIIAKTQDLLRENLMAGALEEFTEALSCLTDGRTKEAVVNAHKSVESVMKCILKVKDHSTFGRLLDNLIKSGLIPHYYEEFMVHFEKMALGAVKERNRPGTGHGQGQEPTEVAKSLSEFSVHLAAVINLFLIRRWIEAHPKEKEKVTVTDYIPPSKDDDDIPF